MQDSLNSFSGLLYQQLAEYSSSPGQHWSLYNSILWLFIIYIYIHVYILIIINFAFIKCFSFLYETLIWYLWAHLRCLWILSLASICPFRNAPWATPVKSATLVLRYLGTVQSTTGCSCLGNQMLPYVSNTEEAGSRFTCYWLYWLGLYQLQWKLNC